MDGRIIFPNDFIPVFEKNKSITLLDFYVYDEVCKYIRKRMDMGKKVVRISVNVSRVHLMSIDELVNYIKSLLSKYKIPPQYEESEWSLFISSLEAQKINLWLKGYSIPNDRTKEKDNKEKYLKKFYKNVKYNKTQLNNNSIASLLKQNKVINTELKSEIAIKRIISNANIKR